MGGRQVVWRDMPREHYTCQSDIREIGARAIRRLRLETDLHDVDGLGVEAGSAVCKVVTPHPDESLVEAEFPHARNRSLEARSPLLESLRIARAEVDRITYDAQAVALGGGAEARGARQHASGEDVALDEVGPAAVIVEVGLVDRDRLECGNAAWGQQVS